MRNFLSCIAGLLVSLQALCQMGIGTDQALFVQSGTTFFVDSLVMVPSTNFTSSNNTLTHYYVPKPGVTPGTNSIARVYTWNTPVPYAGALGIVYSDAELAGNAEGVLQVAYSGPGWVTTTGSSVDMTGNFV